MFNRILFCGVVFMFFVNAAGLEVELDINDANEKDALPSAVIKAVNDAYDLNMNGIELLDKGQYDAAMTAFDKALEILTDYSDAQNNRGVVYYRKGQITNAKEIWEKLCVKDPSCAVASYNLGLLYLHEKQLEAAGRLFERAIKANSKFVEAFVRNGTVWLQLGNSSKALENLQKAYKIAPDQQDAWLFYAYGKLTVKDTAEALSVLKKHEDALEALKMLGTLELSKNNVKKAIDYFQRASMKGADQELLVNYASSLYDEGNCKEALIILEPCFSGKEPASQDAYLIAGLASKECGNANAALKYFEDGNSKYPNDPILQHNLGQMYFGQKKYDKAQQVWNSLSDTAQDPSILYLRAISSRQTNQFDAAEKYIRKALTLDDRSEFHDFLGVVLHQKKDDTGAEAEFRKALKLNSENRSAQLNLALITRKGEDLGVVIQQMEASLKSCSGDTCADIAFGLSIMYYNSKQIDKSIQTLISIDDKYKDERIYRHIALFYRELQQYDKAISTLENVQKKFIFELQTEYELAENYLLAGYYSKAVDKLQALVPKWKENPWRLYYQIGYAYMEQNELEKAKDYFNRSLKSKQDNVAARGLLAFVYNRLGNVGEARSLWEKNLKDDPSNPALWINMGLSFEKEGKYEDALSYYQRAVILKKGDNEVQINIGNAYAGLDRYTDAINAYTLAFSTPKKDLACYDIFLIARKKKDKERAQQYATILQNEFPRSVYTSRVHSEMQLWNGDTTGALSTLENLQDKDNADYLSLASIYASKGDADKTAIYIKKVPDEDPWKKEISTIEAQLSFKKGDYSKALSLLKTSGDTSFISQYNIALISYNAANYGEALSVSERLTRNSSGTDRADCCRLAGNAAFALKQWKVARQWYLQLSGMEASNSVVQYNLAVASYNLNEIENAWKYYQRAKELDKTVFNKDIETRYNQTIGGKGKDSVTVIDSVDVWYNSAVDLQNSGKDTAAELLYKKVLEKKPDHSLALNNLGAIYGKRGDIDNAEKSYQKAIEKRHDIPETYINLINLYIELEEFAKARQWIIKGTGHNPDSEELLKLRDKVAEAEKKTSQNKK